MIFKSSCCCGAELFVDTNADKGPYARPDGKPDDNGYVYRFQQWIDEWNERHLHCEPAEE